MAHVQKNVNIRREQQVQNGDSREEKHQEVEHSSYTHTEVKVPLQVPQPVVMSSVSGLAQGIVGEGMHVNISRITGASQLNQVYESKELQAEAQRDFELKMKEQERLAQEFERELEHRTIVYRKQQEAETELIRKELEKQHVRDVEFRQNLADLAIEQQKKQVDLEMRFAKRELDRQRKVARESLERNKFQEQIQVEIGSAAGSSFSGASTVAESEKLKQERRN
jgi:hypothetical protein